MYKKKFQFDYNKGIENENKVLNFLNLNNKFQKCKKNCPFDFYDDVTFIELKSRNNEYNKYPSTMVGYNKIKIAEEDESKTKYKFLFLFTDGLYQWEFEKDKYLIKDGGRWDRGKSEIKKYCYINIENLKLLNKDINNEKDRDRDKVPNPNKNEN